METLRHAGMQLRKVQYFETSIIPLTEEARHREYFIGELFGIKAEMYAMEPDLLICPQVNAEKPGTGKFDIFLDELKKACAFNAKRLAFASITNERLYKYLQRHNIPVWNGEALFNVDFMTEEEEKAMLAGLPPIDEKSV